MKQTGAATALSGDALILLCRATALLALLGTWSLAAAAAATEPAPLPPEQIVGRMMARNAERSARLRFYRSTRVYELDYHGFPSEKHARMVVNAVFDAPQKTLTIVSEDGSKLLLDRVLHKILAREMEANDAENQANSALSPDNYEFSLLGMEESEPGGTPCYVFQVTPRRRDKFLYDGKVWIDARDFALARIQAHPAKNPSFWISETLIEHEYRKTGEFWLPAINRSTTKVRLGGRAVLTIQYGDYDLSAK